MKKIFKSLTIVTMVVLLVVPVLATPALALDLGTEYGEATELGDTDPRDIAANLIGVILGFLAIIAVIMILIGGFKWMTAGGNEDQVAQARQILLASIIGLAIILAAWGIANFVLDRLLTATGA